PELLDPIPERPEADPEELRGRGLVVTRLLERPEDRVALDLLELRLERSAVGPGRGRGRAGNPCGAVVRLAELDVLDVDLVAGAERQRALEDVLELPYVAGEAVAEERRARGGRQAGHRHALRRREPLEDPVGEQQHVLAALAERRHVELD